METLIARIKQLSPGSYPVASDDVVQAAERSLGFSLPPLLCDLYRFSCVFCREENAPIYVYDSNVPEDEAILLHTTTLAEWLDRWVVGDDLWKQMRRLTPSWIVEQ